jgi:hypothetical protein
VKETCLCIVENMETYVGLVFIIKQLLKWMYGVFSRRCLEKNYVVFRFLN